MHNSILPSPQYVVVWCLFTFLLLHNFDFPSDVTLVLFVGKCLSASLDGCSSEVPLSVFLGLLQPYNSPSMIASLKLSVLYRPSPSLACLCITLVFATVNCTVQSFQHAMDKYIVRHFLVCNVYTRHVFRIQCNSSRLLYFLVMIVCKSGLDFVCKHGTVMDGL